MPTFRAVFRWVSLLGFIGLGLLYLNGAVFRAWVAGGPPNDNPSGWLFSAGNYLFWSISAILAGVSFFMLLNSARPVSKFAVALLVLALGLAAFPLLREFVAADQCLDNGGQWSETELRCNHG